MQRCGTGTLHNAAAYHTMPWLKKQHNAMRRGKEWKENNVLFSKQKHSYTVIAKILLVVFDYQMNANNYKNRLLSGASYL